MRPQIKIWQWPNVLSIDATLVAVLWLAAYGVASGSTIHGPSYLVLALSVWLTYTADRLFDVKSRRLESLRAKRHQFAKLKSKSLWIIWWCLMALNLLTALLLSPEQFLRGIVLLLITLTYTFLSQKLSTRFFPKEIFVAAIFCGGIWVFTPDSLNLSFAIAFFALCLVNCLTIGFREVNIDQALRQKSATSALPNLAVNLITGLGLIFVVVSNFPLRTPIAIGFLALSLLHTYRMRIHHEAYRAMCDWALIVPAFSILIVYLSFD